MAKRTDLPPFAPVDLRVWIEGNGDERDIVGGIRLIQWNEGAEVEIYLDMIVAACYPTGKRTVQRALASCKAKGWVLSNRKKKREGRGLEAPTYSLAVRPMAFKDARIILNQRANLAPRSEEPTRQLELTSAPKLHDQGATVARSILEEKDLSERQSERKTLPADAGGETLKSPAQQFREFFSKQYLLKHGEPMSPVVFDWVPRVESKLVNAGNLEKMKGRVLNFFNDHLRDTHAYDTFLRRPDDWAKPRPRLDGHREDYTSKRKPESEARRLAREMGVEVEE